MTNLSLSKPNKDIKNETIYFTFKKLHWFEC